MKGESEGKIIDEFVGLTSKMYSIKNIDGKESNMVKGVNIATKFEEFKDTLFNKKIMEHKMKRIQLKNIKQEHTKSTKYHYHVLMIKDMFQMMKFTCLLIFIKIVLQAVKRFKKVVIKKKGLKKIVIKKKRLKKIAKRLHVSNNFLFFYFFYFNLFF